MNKGLVVVLRFANRAYVDLDLVETDPKLAIAAFAGRALSNGADLPLLDAFHSEISIESLRRALNKAPQPPPPPSKLPIPVKGLIHAVGFYVKNTGTSNPDIPRSRDTLKAFFARFDIELDFEGEPQ